MQPRTPGAKTPSGEARTVPAACRAPPPGQDINPSFPQESDALGTSILATELERRGALTSW